MDVRKTYLYVMSKKAKKSLFAKWFSIANIESCFNWDQYLSCPSIVKKQPADDCLRRMWIEESWNFKLFDIIFKDMSF